MSIGKSWVQHKNCILCTCTNVVLPDPAIPRHRMQAGFSAPSVTPLVAVAILNWNSSPVSGLLFLQGRATRTRATLNIAKKSKNCIILFFFFKNIGNYGGKIILVSRKLYIHRQLILVKVNTEGEWIHEYWAVFISYTRLQMMNTVNKIPWTKCLLFTIFYSGIHHLQSSIFHIFETVDLHWSEMPFVHFFKHGFGHVNHYRVALSIRSS